MRKVEVKSGIRTSDPPGVRAAEGMGEGCWMDGAGSRSGSVLQRRMSIDRIVFGNVLKRRLARTYEWVVAMFRQVGSLERSALGSAPQKNRRSRTQTWHRIRSPRSRAPGRARAASCKVQRRALEQPPWPTSCLGVKQHAFAFLLFVKERCMLSFLKRHPAFWLLLLFLLFEKGRAACFVLFCEVASRIRIPSNE